MTSLVNSAIRRRKLSCFNCYSDTVKEKNVDLPQFINLFTKYDEIKQDLTKLYRDILLLCARQQTAQRKVLPLYAGQ